MQDRTLEKAAAVGGLYAQLEGRTLAIDQQWHLDAGLTQLPDAAEETGKIAHLGAGNAEDDIAGAQIRLLRRAAAGEPQDGDVAADLGGVDAEPGARGPVGAADGEEVVQDRLDEIDRHDHVDVLE